MNGKAANINHSLTIRGEINSDFASIDFRPRYSEGDGIPRGPVTTTVPSRKVSAAMISHTALMRECARLNVDCVNVEMEYSECSTLIQHHCKGQRAEGLVKVRVRGLAS